MKFYVLTKFTFLLIPLVVKSLYRVFVFLLGPSFVELYPSLICIWIPHKWSEGYFKIEENKKFQLGYYLFNLFLLFLFTNLLLRNHICLNQFLFDSNTLNMMSSFALSLGNGVAVLLTFTYLRAYLNGNKVFEAQKLSPLHKNIPIGY